MYRWIHNLRKTFVKTKIPLYFDSKCVIYIQKHLKKSAKKKKNVETLSDQLELLN